MTASWWHWYWQQSGGNILAMPLQAVITVVATLLLRKPIKRLWHRLVGERADIEDLRAAITEVRERAAAAHKITADLFEHHTGRAHEHAPDKPRED